MADHLLPLARQAAANKTVIAVGGAAAVLLLVAGDYLQWKSLGTGGTPPTIQGYGRMRKMGLWRFFYGDDLKDASPLSKEGPTYLDGPVPKREGGRAKGSRWTMPQRQIAEPITPEALERLATLMHRLSAQHPKLLSYGLSKTEGGTGHAIYANPDLPTVNPDAHKIRYEVAHVHPSENSLHVYASPADAREVVEAEWGERFPVSWIAPASWIMVYAPRNEEEVEVVERIVRAAVGWNTGVKV
ncbi:uncharacterized protein BDZ99DRAFT_461080 [Mytilinidion resinicola]|uniref:Luciferase domain-containing protein n=1 Tax=Mytilinidion resinicola TaxID=574789 RepID=A0A6A6YV09_9PEZI|nr:uncharacterized protein BDZ99DRAFT_461080 [Mytilinidion resinicola]KAF2812359.1 hypothetical protein BDZ99DRAFT_461080 [Mytilinidion resinicola]